MNLNDSLQKHKAVIFGSLAVMGAGALAYGLYLELRPSTTSTATTTTTTHTAQTHTSPQINDTASHPEQKPTPNPLETCLKDCQSLSVKFGVRVLCEDSCRKKYASSGEVQRPKGELTGL